MEPVRESLEDMQARHRAELKDLETRVASKKKNATKKTRRGVHDECAQMERVLRERQAGELTRVQGDGEEDGEAAAAGEDDALPTDVEGRMAEMDLGARREQQQQQQQQQQGQQGQPGRKRNRQKERLARRAAEREAAAEEASAEASNMTDHRGRERTSLRRVFEAQGLVEREMAPDGHCLFAAVADQLLAAGVVSSLEGKSEAGTPEPPYRT
ncbi:hypothetical protein E4U42_006940, partial [Claviceps africana]